MNCVRTLPSTPDLVFPRLKKRRNAARDRTGAALEALGWRVLTVWECELGPREAAALRARVRRFLRG